MSSCTTLQQKLMRLENEKKQALMTAAIEDTLEEYTGFKFCISGTSLNINVSPRYGRYTAEPWVLAGPIESDVPKALHIWRSLAALFDFGAWSMPYYYELDRHVTFRKEAKRNDPFAWHMMCQPYYWEGYFTGNTGDYRQHTMTLKAEYKFILNEASRIMLKEQGVESPQSTVRMAVNIEMDSYKFPGLDLSRKVSSPAGKKIYGYKAELKGWNAIRWHGGYSNYGAYPYARQTFWNACAGGDCE